jgi:hypothetical protein
MYLSIACHVAASGDIPAWLELSSCLRPERGADPKVEQRADELRQGQLDRRPSGRSAPQRLAGRRESHWRRDPRHSSRRGPVLNLEAVSIAELREVMQARRHDPLSILLGRFAQSLTAAGEIDPQLGLSYAIWQTEAMLEAVAETTPGPHRHTDYGLDGEYEPRNHAGVATLRGVEDYTSKYKGEQVEVALFGGEYQEGVLTAYCYVDEVAHIELNGHILVPLQNIASLHCSSRCDAPQNEDWPPRGLLEDDGQEDGGDDR